MMGFLIETIIMAFVVGGVIGAITALQLNSNANKVPVKIQRVNPQNRNRFR